MIVGYSLHDGINKFQNYDTILKVLQILTVKLNDFTDTYIHKRSKRSRSSGAYL
jgi:hypothetical protein